MALATVPTPARQGCPRASTTSAMAP
jgi:hypothetical protein